LVTFRGAAALAFFTTVFILYTSFPRSVTYGFRVYVGKVTAVSHKTALDSQRLLAAEAKNHDEITENRPNVVLAMVRYEEVVVSESYRKRFSGRLGLHDSRGREGVGIAPHTVPDSLHAGMTGRRGVPQTQLPGIPL
jgi:hypothetical protein